MLSKSTEQLKPARRRYQESLQSQSKKPTVWSCVFIMNMFQLSGPQTYQIYRCSSGKYLLSGCSNQAGVLICFMVTSPRCTALAKLSFVSRASLQVIGWGARFQTASKPVEVSRAAYGDASLGRGGIIALVGTSGFPLGKEQP